MAANDRTTIRGITIRARSVQTPNWDLTEEELQPGRYYEATCLATDMPGDLVRVTGEAGGIPSVAKVDPTDLAQMPADGMILQKVGTTTNCAVVSICEYVTTGLTRGRNYYVGLDAAPLLGPPAPTPTGLVVLQHVGYAVTTTRLRVQINHLLRIKRGVNT